MTVQRCDAHFGESDRRCTREAGHTQPLHTIPGEISWLDTLVMRRTSAARLYSGELFAGVGGLGMAVDEVFGSTPAWFCEFDTAPSRVLAHHFPDVPNYGDVRAVDFRTLPHTQIRAGGFPCQDVSLAGRRRGMTGGTRSGLWSEFARSIEEDRPDWVVIENVRGLLSADASSDLEPCPLCVGDNPEHVLRALGAVLGDLADLGFDAEWTGIRAADIGAPHGRFRVFILAWPSERTATDAGHGSGHREWTREVSGEGSPQPGLTLLPTPAVVQSDGESVESWQARRARIKATGINGNGMGMPLPIAVQLLPTPDAYAGSRGGSQNPEKRRDGGHTVSLADVTEHALLGTPRTAQGVMNDLRDPVVIGNPRGRLEDQLALLPTPTVGDKGGTAARGGEGFGAPLGEVTRSLTDWGPYAAAVGRWEAVVERPAPDPVRFDGKGGKARLNPELTEWMMGWPAGWVTASEIGLSRAEQLKACGNGVVPQQAAAAIREMLARPGVPALVDFTAVAS
jgi:DNA (cytosine-5)-methyltransferase 1